MRIDNIPSQGASMDYNNIFKLEPSKKHLFDVSSIQPKLTEEAGSLANSLLGAPNPKFSNAAALRYGNKGSLLVTIAGPKQGLWYDHEAGQGGNLLQLIQYINKCNFKTSLDYAANFLGIEQNNNVDNNDKSKYPNKIYDLSSPIVNTLAQKYLVEHRKITADIGEHIRFMPELWEPITKTKYPAMVVFAKNIDGAIRGMQATWLDQTTGNKLDIDVPKRSYGEIKAAMVPISHGGFAIAVAEGIETALSVLSARPNLTIFAALGSFTNFSQCELKANGAPLILCGDNDVNNTQTIQRLNKAATELSEKGFNVFVAKPKEAGFDFNDVLKQCGARQVAAILDSAVMLQPAKIHQKIVVPKSSVQQKSLECELEI